MTFEERIAERLQDCMAIHPVQYDNGADHTLKVAFETSELEGNTICLALPVRKNGIVEEIIFDIIVQKRED